MENGWHDISDEEYFALDCITSSHLKAIHSGGTAYAKAKKYRPFRPSQRMREGTALHYSCFDRVAFNKVVVEKPTFSGTGSRKAAADWEAEAAANGSIVLTAAKYDAIERMGQMARDVIGFNVGRMEVAGYFDCPLTGPRAIKVDYLTDDCIWDLKLTSATTRRAFQRQAQDLEYWIQSSWYVDTAYKIDSIDRPFRWICVTEDPIRVVVYQADACEVDEGIERCNALARAWDCSVKQNEFAPRIEILEIMQ